MSETKSLKWVALFLIAFSLFYSTSFLFTRDLADRKEYSLFIEARYNHPIPDFRISKVMDSTNMFQLFKMGLRCQYITI